MFLLIEQSWALQFKVCYVYITLTSDESVFQKGFCQLALVRSTTKQRVYPWKLNHISLLDRRCDSASPRSRLGDLELLEVFDAGSSKWRGMLWFSIVWQRCLLDMPYQKYRLPIISGSVKSSLKFYLQSTLKEASRLPRGLGNRGRAVTETSQSRPG